MPTFMMLLSLWVMTPTAHAETFDAIAAVVNNEALSCYDIQHTTNITRLQLKQSNQETPPTYHELRKRILDAKIIKLLQIQDAKRLGLSVSAEELNRAIQDTEARNNLMPGQLETVIKQQGLDMDEYKQNLKEQILIGKLINVAVRDKLQISEEAMREYYRKYLATTEPRREVKLAQIFLPVDTDPSPEALSTARKKAQLIHQQLKQGQSFSRMVTLHSESQEREQDGIMGWFMPGGITQRFASVLELPVDTVSDPIRSPSGFHIFKILEERWQKPERVDESYDEVHARHILLMIPSTADEATVSKIRQRAERVAADMQGASEEEFISRAKEASQGPSAERGGDLGWFKRGDMLPAFENVAFKLKAGETSGVVESTFGLHIIRVIASRHIDPNSFEAHRDKIHQTLSNSEMQEQHPRWLAALKAKASIETFTCDPIADEK